jgi:predicted outer membrane repeat protein
MDQASLAVIDCIFSGNLATGDGGAIHSRSEAPFPPVVVGCLFDSNSANVGGATWAQRGLDVVDCVFQSNSAVVDGGGSYFSRNPMGDGAFSIVHECRYLACDAMFGGGIRGSDATLSVSESTFSGCVGGDEFRPSGWGGGISMVDARLEVSDSTFSGCIGGRNGGAIDADDSEIEALNCAFSGCTSIDYAGAVNEYGPLTTLAFDGCSFTGNLSYEGIGGAIGCAEFSSTTHATEFRLANCTFDDSLGWLGASCIDAGNVVSAIDCEFGEQGAPQIPGSGVKVAIRGLGSGSLFERCTFVDGLLLDGTSAFRASAAGPARFVSIRWEQRIRGRIPGGDGDDGQLFHRRPGLSRVRRRCIARAGLDDDELSRQRLGGLQHPARPRPWADRGRPLHLRRRDSGELGMQRGSGGTRGESLREGHDGP